MPKALPIALLVLALSAGHPVSVEAWGFTGHRFITDHAIDLLPPEIRPFFQTFRTALVEHSIDPDTYRTVGFTEESPRHFLDMTPTGLSVRIRPTRYGGGRETWRDFVLKAARCLAGRMRRGGR
jgi:hypothetical protein